MMEFIKRTLAQVLAAFKAKNQKIWAVVLGVATALQFGLEGALEAAATQVGLVIDLPTAFLSLDWIVTHFALPISDTATDWIMWLLIAISGAETTEFLSPEKREKRLTKQAERIEKRELKALQKEAAKNL